MPTILVPVDGSAASIRALEHAGRRKHSTSEALSIIVLNVQTPLPPSRFVTRSILNQHYVRMSNRALSRARATARRLKIDVRFYVRRGHPASTIARFAHERKCSEIIMDTRGRGKFGSLFLGSVALAVIQLGR